MATGKQIKDAADDSRKWLKGKQKLHLDMVETATKKLQKNILDTLTELSTKNGRVEGLSANLTNLQTIQKKIERIFGLQFNPDMRKITDDFKTAKNQIKSNFKIVDEAVKFTSIDNEIIQTLADGSYQEYLGLSGAAKNQVTQAMYNHVIAGDSFSDLVNTINGALVGTAAKSVTGRPLAQYARLYARDQIMNFHNDVMLKKASDIEMDHFLYFGTIMGGTRKFCRRRVGNVYTKKEIDSWKYKWQGKSGPAFTHRGGYNCRHHWQPVRKEWLSDQQLQGIDKLKQLDKEGKVVKPGKKTKPEPKPVKKKIPKTIGKGIVPNAPTLKSIKEDIKKFEQTSEYKTLFNTKVGLDTEIAALDKKLQKTSAKMQVLRGKYGYSEISLVPEFEKQKGIYLDIATEKTLLTTEQKRVDGLITKSKNKILNDKIIPPKGGKIKFEFQGNYSKTIQNKFTKNFEEIEDLFHPDVLKQIPSQQVRYQAGIRAYYTRESTVGRIKRKSTIHLGSGDTLIQTHEFGHAVENSIPGLQQKARSFLRERAGEALPTRIFTGKKEVGWKDGFFNHYVGKYYPADTEIISMGLEQMKRDPLFLFEKDPGHFEIILKTMWGVE